MLFGYPVEATAENWLHECLHEILHLIHSCIATGKSPPAWPDIIPESYRNRLQRRTGLRDKLKAYQIAVAKLMAVEQNRILEAFNDQNKIALLLSCREDCEAITDLPAAIHEPVKTLFEFAFSLLTNLEIRDKHYKTIYDAASYHTCPFCGCEYFDAPGAPREDLDHYLAKSKYSFASANLRNLVPMGNKCNSYKLTQDILKRDDGTRRKSFDPYNHRIVTISLDNSQPFAGKVGTLGAPLPKWTIDFSPDSEEVTTWDDVFHIRERYERDVLDEGFNAYLREFGNHCRRFYHPLPSSTEELIDAIEKYTGFQEDNGLRDKAFLKASVFRMLHIHCQKGDQRLIKLIRDVVNDVSV